MNAGPGVSVDDRISIVVARSDDLLGCFDATCSDVFVTACHLVDGDRNRAEMLTIDVYLALRRVVGDGTTVVVDHDWMVATALGQLLGHEPDGGSRVLTALERAVLELHRIDGRDIDTVATMLGLSAGEVERSLARFEDGSRFSTDLVEDLLRRSELWLDDLTRRRVRAAIRRGERPAFVQRPERLTDDDLRRTDVPGQPPEQAGPDDQLPPPRRSAIAVVCTVVAALAIAAVWLMPGDDPTDASVVGTLGSAGDAASAPATTAAAEPATPTPWAAAVEAGGTTEPNGGPTGAWEWTESNGPRPAEQPGFVLADPPNGFTVASTSEIVDPPRSGTFVLWAEPGATRTTGRWLAIATTVATPSRTVVVPDASRELIGGNPATVVTAADGVAVLTVQPAGGGQFALSGSGFSTDELRQLAAGVRLRDGEPVIDPNLDTLRAGLVERVRAPSPSGDLGRQAGSGRRRWVTYLAEDTRQFLTLTTRDTTADDLLIGELLLPPSADTLAPAAPSRTFQMGDLQLSVSGPPFESVWRATRSTERSAISWHDGDQTLTLAGDVEMYVLLGAISSARPATVDEWAASFSRSPTELPGSQPDSLRGEPVRIGTTSLDDGTRWVVSLGSDPLGVRFQVRNLNVAGIMGEDRIDPVAGPSLHDYVTMSCTMLVAIVPDRPDATGIRITIAGHTPITVPLVPIGDSGLGAAGYVFDDVAPYTVEMVDATGSPLGPLTP